MSAVNNWRPISSAPLDEVLMLGWWVNLFGGWSFEVEIEHYDGTNCATHWQPVPADPPLTAADRAHVAAAIAKATGDAS